MGPKYRIGLNQGAPGDKVTSDLHFSSEGTNGFGSNANVSSRSIRQLAFAVMENGIAQCGTC